MFGRHACCAVCAPRRSSGQAASAGAVRPAGQRPRARHARSGGLEHSAGVDPRRGTLAAVRARILGRYPGPADRLIHRCDAPRRRRDDRPAPRSRHLDRKRDPGRGGARGTATTITRRRRRRAAGPTGSFRASAQHGRPTRARRGRTSASSSRAPRRVSPARRRTGFSWAGSAT